MSPSFTSFMHTAKNIRFGCGIGATAVVMAIAVYFEACSYSIYEPTQFDPKRMQAIVSYVETHPGAVFDHQVDLPNGLASLSINGRVYVDAFGYFVPSWIGRKTFIDSDPFEEEDRWIEGYVYVKDDTSDLSKDEDPFYDVCVPGFTSVWNSKMDRTIGKGPMFFESRISPHWYTINSFS